MLDIQALYEKLYRDLALIRQQESEERIKNQGAVQFKKQQTELRITELEKQIDCIRPFQVSAAAFVMNSLRQKSYPPRNVDISELDQLYYLATTSTVNSMAIWERLYESASSGISYYSNAISRLRAESIFEPVSCSDKYNDACKKVLSSPTAAELSRAFEVVKNTYTPSIIASKPFIPVQKESSALFGRSTKPFPVTDDCIVLAKQVFQGAFSETDQTLLMPCSLPKVTLFQIGSNIAEEVLRAVRAYIISFLKFSIPTIQKINLIDTCTLDTTCTGILQPFLQGIIMPIPDTQEACESRLASLRKLLCSETTHHRRLLIYRFKKSVYDPPSNSCLQWLCSNAEKYNIQVIALQETAHYEQDLDSQKPDWVPLNSLVIRFGSSRCLESSITHSKIATYQEPSNLSSEYLDSILAAYAPAPLKTRFFDVHPKPSKAISYKRDRRKPISLLYGIDRNGEKYALNLSGADFSAYILGAARSGKSNLLNILITSAIMDYHPDDLELWLIDFGRTEFSRYVHHTPPHVRYVLVEKTTELVCSLVDKLINEMKRRGEILSKNNVLKIQDLPESVHMPTLLVMIDEFGVFKEVLNGDDFEEKKKYRMLMERLLKQGAKHGVCFIFANQSYTDVYSALPEEASDQIGLRLAMLAKTEEMTSVLGARDFQLTEQERMKITNLPKYQVIFRSREKGGCLSEPINVLYFTEEDRMIQESMIDNMCIDFQPAAHSRLDPVNTYIQHPQLCLDHNSIPTFKDRLLDIRSDYQEWTHDIAFQKTDLLLYLGEPRNMDSVHHEILTSERSQNLLLYGDYKQNLNGIASIVSGAANSALFQKWSIEYWCNEKDRLGEELENRWTDGIFIKDPEKLVSHIKELNLAYEQKKLSQKLIIISGLSACILSIRDAIEESQINGSNKQSSEELLQAIRAQMANGNIPEDPDVHSDHGLEDIIPYLSRLFKFGPRYNVHFIVVVQKETELDDADLSLEHFSHYAAFSSGMSNTQHYMFKRRVDRISEDEMFGCMSGNGDFTVYTPFSQKRKENQ